MTKQKKLRHTEYYDLQEVFDKLYADSGKGKIFNNLMEHVSDENNIRLAYRNIKRNSGSNTSGVDKISIKDIEKLGSEKYVEIIQRKLAWYIPKPVKRVEIPKPNGKMRPLGIPTIMDRLVQQCILQVPEPICEAKFHERNNGFRPNRSTEHALAQCYRMIQKQQLHFVVDIDIKGFFDNVNHAKLIRQMWTLGIRDKTLLCIIKAILKAPVVMPDGSTVYCGTAQGGVISPLLSNIVLNELDWWISSQWETMPTHSTFKQYYNNNGSPNNSYRFKVLKKSNLKEMYIVRYADDFKIFCRTRSDADKVYIAVKKWLKERLYLDISEEKSKLVNLKKHTSDFLGFKLKAVCKRDSYAVYSNMSEKAFGKVSDKLTEQIKRIQHSENMEDTVQNVKLYNSMVFGIHNYYGYATNITLDCRRIQYRLNMVNHNRLKGRVKKKGTIQRKYIREHYGGSEQVRFICGEPLCPIGYMQTRNPMYKKRSICKYTADGRAEIHKNLCFNESVMRVLHMLGNRSDYGRSIEYCDNRISLYAAQMGRCAVTGQEQWIDELHCHHKIPVSNGGTDEYWNLVILHEDVHRLIHATTDETVKKYLNRINPSQTMLEKINNYREMVGNDRI